jgi:pilus assembly protein Flp/PilA
MTARRAIRRALLDEAGTTAIEYAILAGLVAVVIIGGAASLGRALDSYYGETRDELVEEIEAPPAPG